VRFPDRSHAGSLKLFLAGLLLALISAGCASLRVPPPEPGGFILRGKLAVVEGDQSVSARFLWRQSGDHFAIDLWGPLGQGQLRLEGDQHELVLFDGAGGVLTRGSHEAVMAAQLGWTLPLAVLPAWVQGRPDPTLPTADSRTDGDGRLESFSQLDWAISLGRYRAIEKASGDRNMPHLVSARRGVYRVRLAISEWQF
jgi:outer membrane lipoprotein LolB